MVVFGQEKVPDSKLQRTGTQSYVSQVHTMKTQIKSCFGAHWAVRVVLKNSAILIKDPKFSYFHGQNK